MLAYLHGYEVGRGVKNVFSRASSKIILHRCLDFHQIPNSHAHSLFFFFPWGIALGERTLRDDKVTSLLSSFKFSTLENSKKLRAKVQCHGILLQPPPRK